MYRDLGGSWEEDFAAYATLGGYLYVDPECVIMGKPVRRDGGCPAEQWNVANPDAWYVRFAVGRGCLPKFVRLIPFPLEWVGWGREMKKQPVRWFSMRSLIRRK